MGKVHTDTGISIEVMSILNSFDNDIWQSNSAVASRITNYNKSLTFISDEIVTLVLSISALINYLLEIVFFLEPLIYQANFCIIFMIDKVFS